MRHKNEFGTQMKNTHTGLIRIRDAHTRLVKNTLRALYPVKKLILKLKIFILNLDLKNKVYK